LKVVDGDLVLKLFGDLPAPCEETLARDGIGRKVELLDQSPEHTEDDLEVSIHNICSRRMKTKRRQGRGARSWPGGSGREVRGGGG